MHRFTDTAKITLIHHWLSLNHVHKTCGPVTILQLFRVLHHIRDGSLVCYETVNLFIAAINTTSLELSLLQCPSIYSMSILHKYTPRYCNYRWCLETADYMVNINLWGKIFWSLLHLTMEGKMCFCTEVAIKWLLLWHLFLWFSVDTCLALLLVMSSTKLFCSFQSNGCYHC